LIKKFRLSSSIDLYGQIYHEKIDLLEIKRILTGETDKGEEQKPGQVRETRTSQGGKANAAEQDDVLFLDTNLKKVNYKLARCCNPVPGDPVFGFVTISRGITLHTHHCPNAKQLLERYGYRKIDVRWKGQEEKETFRTTIHVTGTDRIGIMNEISQIISNDLKFNMISVKIDARKGVFTGIIKLMVRNNGSIPDLIQKISRVGGVSRVVKTEG
jgi:GTP pyrophosphokinase